MHNYYSIVKKQRGMMLLLKLTLVTASVLLSCDAGIVDTLPKCSMRDDECMRSLYQNVLQDVGINGIPELNIPPVDPMNLDNFSVTVMDALTVTVNKGVVKGVSKCVFNSFHLDLEKNTGTQETTCDLSFKGQVSVGGTSPALQSLLGMNSVKGEGKTKVKLEKVHIRYEFPVFVIKKDDGNTYFKVLYKNIKYKCDIGKATFLVEKVFVGNEDIGPGVTTFMNQNSKTMIDTFASKFVDKAMDIYFSFAKNFFEAKPTKEYITEDLTSYVK